MQTVAALFLVLVAVQYAQAGATEMKITKEAIFSIMKTCREKSNATDADIEEFKKVGILNSRAAKCYLACFFTAANIMTADNKFNKEGTMLIADKLFDKDKELMEMAKRNIENCEKEVMASGQTEMCEVAGACFNCYKGMCLDVIYSIK